MLRLAGLVAVTSLLLLVPAARPRAVRAQPAPRAPASAPTGAPASAPTIDAVLASMSRVRALRVRYHEEKRVALLTRPITSEGTIDFLRGEGSTPTRMARRTTRPNRQVVLIDGDALRMSDGRTTSRIDLASQPVVRSFVDSFLQLLVGDRAALERTYTLSVEAAEPGWALILRPKNAPLTTFLSEIRFEGDAEGLTRMTMTEVSGDVTTTTFSDAELNHRYDAAELARAFSLTL